MSDEIEIHELVAEQYGRFRSEAGLTGHPVAFAESLTAFLRERGYEIQPVQVRPIVEAAKTWRAMRAGTPTIPKPESAALIAAVDALPVEMPDPT